MDDDSTLRQIYACLDKGVHIFKEDDFFETTLIVTFKFAETDSKGR